MTVPRIHEGIIGAGSEASMKVHQKEREVRAALREAARTPNVAPRTIG